MPKEEARRDKSRHKTMIPGINDKQYLAVDDRKRRNTNRISKVQ